MYTMFTDLIQCNLDELETRDVDQFYLCTKENAEDALRRKLTPSESEELYSECESYLNSENK